MIALTILMNEFLVKLQNSSVELRILGKRDVFRLLFIVSLLLLIVSRLTGVTGTDLKVAGTHLKVAGTQ